LYEEPIRIINDIYLFQTLLQIIIICRCY